MSDPDFQRTRYIVDLIDRTVAWVEHTGYWLLPLLVLSAPIWSQWVIEDKREERRIEHVTRCDRCVRVEYSPPQESHDAIFAWEHGYHCPKPCID